VKSKVARVAKGGCVTRVGHRPALPSSQYFGNREVE
jgi:hypothetical protein